MRKIDHTGQQGNKVKDPARSNRSQGTSADGSLHTQPIAPARYQETNVSQTQKSTVDLKQNKPAAGGRHPLSLETAGEGQATRRGYSSGIEMADEHLAHGSVELAFLRYSKGKINITPAFQILANQYPRESLEYVRRFMVKCNELYLFAKNQIDVGAHLRAENLLVNLLQFNREGYQDLQHPLFQVKVLNLLASCQRHLSKLQEAEESLEISLMICDKYKCPRAESLLTLGALQMDKGDFSTAKDSCQECIRLLEPEIQECPNKPEARFLATAYYNLGHCCMELGDRGVAINMYGKSLAILKRTFVSTKNTLFVTVQEAYQEAVNLVRTKPGTQKAAIIDSNIAVPNKEFQSLKSTADQKHSQPVSEREIKVLRSVSRSHRAQEAEEGLDGQYIRNPTSIRKVDSQIELLKKPRPQSSNLPKQFSPPKVSLKDITTKVLHRAQHSSGEIPETIGTAAANQAKMVLEKFSQPTRKLGGFIVHHRRTLTTGGQPQVQKSPCPFFELPPKQPKSLRIKVKLDSKATAAHQDTTISRSHKRPLMISSPSITNPPRTKFIPQGDVSDDEDEQNMRTPGFVTNPDLGGVFSAITTRSEKMGDTLPVPNSLDVQKASVSLQPQTNSGAIKPVNSNPSKSSVAASPLSDKSKDQSVAVRALKEPVESANTPTQVGSFRPQHNAVNASNQPMSAERKVTAATRIQRAWRRYLSGDGRRKRMMKARMSSTRWIINKYLIVESDLVKAEGKRLFPCKIMVYLTRTTTVLEVFVIKRGTSGTSPHLKPAADTRPKLEDTKKSFRCLRWIGTVEVQLTENFFACQNKLRIDQRGKPYWNQKSPTFVKAEPEKSIINKPEDSSKQRQQIAAVSNINLEHNRKTNDQSVQELVDDSKQVAKHLPPRMPSPPIFLKVPTTTTRKKSKRNAWSTLSTPKLSESVSESVEVEPAKSQNPPIAPIEDVRKQITDLPASIEYPPAQKITFTPLTPFQLVPAHNTSSQDSTEGATHQERTIIQDKHLANHEDIPQNIIDISKPILDHQKTTELKVPEPSISPANLQELLNLKETLEAQLAEERLVRTEMIKNLEKVYEKKFEELVSAQLSTVPPQPTTNLTASVEPTKTVVSISPLQKAILGMVPKPSLSSGTSVNKITDEAHVLEMIPTGEPLEAICIFEATVYYLPKLELAKNPQNPVEALEVFTPTIDVLASPETQSHQPVLKLSLPPPPSPQAEPKPSTPPATSPRIDSRTSTPSPPSLDQQQEQTQTENVISAFQNPRKRTQSATHSNHNGTRPRSTTECEQLIRRFFAKTAERMKLMRPFVLLRQVRDGPDGRYFIVIYKQNNILSIRVSQMKRKGFYDFMYLKLNDELNRRLIDPKFLQEQIVVKHRKIRILDSTQPEEEEGFLLTSERDNDLEVVEDPNNASPIIEEEEDSDSDASESEVEAIARTRQMIIQQEEELELATRDPPKPQNKQTWSRPLDQTVKEEAPALGSFQRSNSMKNASMSFSRLELIEQPQQQKEQGLMFQAEVKLISGGKEGMHGSNGSKMSGRKEILKLKGNTQEVPLSSALQNRRVSSPSVFQVEQPKNTMVSRDTKEMNLREILRFQFFSVQRQKPFWLIIKELPKGGFFVVETEEHDRRYIESIIFETEVAGLMFNKAAKMTAKERAEWLAWKIAPGISYLRSVGKPIPAFGADLAFTSHADRMCISGKYF